MSDWGGNLHMKRQTEDSIKQYTPPFLLKHVLLPKETDLLFIPIL